MASMISVSRTLVADMQANRGRPHLQVFMILFRLAHASGAWSWPIRLASLPIKALYRTCGHSVVSIDIPSRTEIGAGLTIHHGFGVVVHSRTILGRGVTIRQGVTLGEKHPGGGAPVVGDRVSLGPHALVLGGVTIEHDAIVGAGSVVTKDVPARATVAGVPGRLLSRDSSTAE